MTRGVRRGSVASSASLPSTPCPNVQQPAKTRSAPNAEVLCIKPLSVATALTTHFLSPKKAKSYHHSPRQSRRKKCPFCTGLHCLTKRSGSQRYAVGVVRLTPTTRTWVVHYTSSAPGAWVQDPWVSYVTIPVMRRRILTSGTTVVTHYLVSPGNTRNWSEDGVLGQLEYSPL